MSAFTPEEMIAYNTKRIHLIDTLIRPHVEERDRLSAEVQKLNEQLRKQKGEEVKARSIEEQIPYYLDKETFRRNMVGVREFFRGMGIDSGTCTASSDQVGLAIALNQSGSNLDQVCESLKMIAPHFKANRYGDLNPVTVIYRPAPQLNPKSVKNVTLRIHNDYWQLYVGCDLVVRSRDLKEMLAYIANNYYYLSIRDQKISDDLNL